MNDFDRARNMTRTIAYAEMLVGHLQGLGNLDISGAFRARVFEAARELHLGAIEERRIRDELVLEWEPVVQPESEDVDFEFPAGHEGKVHPGIPTDGPRED